MSTVFASKCIDKALGMQDKVKSEFNSLHDINLLFDFSGKTDNGKKIRRAHQS